MPLSPISDRAQALHDRSIIVDGCSFFLKSYNDRIRQAGLTAINFTVTMPMEEMGPSIMRVKEYREIAKRDPMVEIPLTAADIERCKARGTLAAIIGTQNTCHFSNDLALIEVFYLLGQRVCQLTYNERNYVGDGYMEPANDALSFFGRQVVAELNNLGMLVDLSHVGERSAIDAAKRSTRPVAITHTGLKKFVDTPRNVNDDVVRAVADTGGVIGLTSFAVLNWRGGDRRPSIDDLLESIEYVINLVGIDHVGIGTDHVAQPGNYPQWVRDHASAKYGPYLPERASRAAGLAKTLEGVQLEQEEQLDGFRGMQDLPRITHALLERGYSEQDVQKVMGGNFMRLFREVWGG
jgi:membrane dipeptidase